VSKKSIQSQTVREIPLPNKGLIAYVSDEDYERVSALRWWAQTRKDRNLIYARSKIKGKPVSMHRFILDLTDPKIIVDHIDGNGLKNTRDNIRVCETSANIQKGSKPLGKSKYLGVTERWRKYEYVHKDGSMTEKVYFYWEANIRKDRKLYFLGTFKDERKAALAYNAKALELYGEHAQINKIDE
jgi:hypothetical protein